MTFLIICLKEKHHIVSFLLNSSYNWYMAQSWGSGDQTFLQTHSVHVTHWSQPPKCYI